MSGFENDVVVGKNLNFDNSASPPHLGILDAAGKLPIGTGNTAPTPEILGGSITSPLGTLSIGYSSPNITIDLTGGGAGIDSIAVQTGISPVVANPSGTVEIDGEVVSSGTNPIRTSGTAASALAVQVQISQAIASTDATKIGLSNFDSSRFTVDGNGFVSLNASGVGETITGDSGGALSPSSGNWTIAGLSGSKTSGSGSTLTVKSPPFSQIGSSATSVLNSGEFVTAAVTRTLPASAGLADGDLFIFVCTTAGALVVQSVSAQKIRVGSNISSAAGTATSTAIGDSLTLRFNATDGFFYAVSSIGTWTLA